VRIAVLYDKGNPVAPAQWREVQTAAQTLGIEPQLFDVRKPEDIGPAFDVAISNRASTLVVHIDALMQTNRMLMAELAAKHRLLTIYVSRAKLP
jgi:hypothetical protein